MKNIFEKEISNAVIARINNLESTSKPEWGKMSVAQMLTHLNKQYKVIYENDKFPKPNAFMRFMLKTFVKKLVVGPKPFKRNVRTAPYLLVKEDKNFEAEKNKLVDYINLTQQNGIDALLPIDTKSFGKLTADEWNTFFYKHLDHHLTQFKV